MGVQFFRRLWGRVVGLGCVFVVLVLATGVLAPAGVAQAVGHERPVAGAAGLKKDIDEFFELLGPLEGSGVDLSSVKGTIEKLVKTGGDSGHLQERVQALKERVRASAHTADAKALAKPDRGSKHKLVAPPLKTTVRRNADRR